LPLQLSLCEHGCMVRVFLYLRMIFEGAAGFIILLTIPFSAIDLLHDGGPTRFLLINWLLLCILFLLGIVLFRDSIILRFRLKARLPD
jgi:hypothetical protein